MTLCRSGLFVGIDYERDLQKREMSVRGSSSAAKLCAYFESAMPTGTWRYSSSGRRVALTRKRILREVHFWLPSIPQGSCGLLYLAGHGAVTADGLVITPVDFDSSIAFDSGVPLGRLIHLLADPTSARTRYVVFLDCCRTGCMEPIHEAIPGNVCIVYSCQQGEAASESGESSACVDAFLRAVAKCNTKMSGGVRAFSLHDVLLHTKRELLASSAPCPQTMEVVGADPDSMSLPAGEVSIGPNLAVNRPEAFLESRHVPPILCAEYRSRVDACIKAWCGYAVDASAIDECSPAGWRLVVALPRDVPVASSGGLWGYLVTQCYSLFFGLRMVWNGRLNEASLRGIARSRQCEYTQISGSEAIMTWTQDKCKGKARISFPTEGTTVLLLGAESSEGNALPLEYLMPGVSVLYECLCRTDVKR